MLQDFIFVPSVWLGEGKISFNSSSEFLKFYTKWYAHEVEPGVLHAEQTVAIIGVEEEVKNSYIFKDISETHFTVILENPLFGQLLGTGIRNEQMIAWEFKDQESFEGFEVYEKQENGDFFFHAEYGAPAQFRTIIEGLIWRKDAPT